MKFTKNDEAVSPVIGVILMVAITVILAAVIAAFVFGMAGNIQKTKVVAATAQQIGSGISVVYQGGQDNNAVSSVTGTINGVNMIGGPITKGAIGKSLHGPGTNGQDHVIVIANFNDGSTQVILDTNV